MSVVKFNTSARKNESRPNSKISLVGGILLQGVLSENDNAYIHTLIRVLDTYRVPLSEGLAGCAGYFSDKPIDPSIIDVVNLDGLGHKNEKTGTAKRDFLTETIDTDILVLANVAFRQSEKEDFLTGLYRANLSPRAAFMLESAMAVSPHNADIGTWQEKIKDSNAQIVLVVGADDVAPEKIAGEDYVILRKTVGGFRGLLFSREYLKEILQDLKNVKSPLYDVAAIASSNLDIVEFTFDNERMKFNPVFPEDIFGPAQKPAAPLLA